MNALIYLLKAVKPIFSDMLSTIVFVGVIWLAVGWLPHYIIWATVLGIATGVVQTVWLILKRKPIGPLQWLSLGLVTCLGTTTILTENPTFIMLKPSIIALAMGAMLLRREWMAPYIPSIVSENLDDRSIRNAGHAWAFLMLLLAGLNVAFAFLTNPFVWSIYLVTLPPASYVVLLGIQYLMYGKIIIAKINARKAAKTA